MKTKNNIFRTVILLFGVLFFVTSCTEEELRDFKDPVQGYWYNGKKHTFKDATYQVDGDKGRLIFNTTDPNLGGSISMVYQWSEEFTGYYSVPVGNFTYYRPSDELYIEAGILFFAIIGTPRFAGGSVVDIVHVEGTTYKVHFDLKIYDPYLAKSYEAIGNYEGEIKNITKLAY